MSNRQRNRPTLLKLKGHDDVPAGQSTSSTNDSTPYGAPHRALAAIPGPLTGGTASKTCAYVQLPANLLSGHNTAGNTQRRSSFEQDYDATPNAPQAEDLETPLPSPFSDFTPPESNDTPSTDTQQTESRATAATPASTVIRRHTSVPSLRTSSRIPARSTVIPRIPSVQSTLYARPNITMEAIDASSFEAGELRDIDLDDFQPQPRPELPSVYNDLPTRPWSASRGGSRTTSFPLRLPRTLRRKTIDLGKCIAGMLL